MMKNVITILLILFIPIAVYMFFSQNTSTVANPNVTNKPQVIKFTSSMCLDCQKMNKIFKEIFPKYKSQIVLTEIQVQDSSSFSNSQIEKYNVTLVPTIILLNSNGKQIKRIEGAIEQEEMEKLLQGLK